MKAKMILVMVILGLLVGLVVVPGVGAKQGPEVVGLDVSAAPWFPNLATVMTPDQDLLDELARDYAHSTDTPSENEFLTGYLPKVIFEDHLGARPSQIPLETKFWLLHVSGYYGGVFLEEYAPFPLPSLPIFEFMYDESVGLIMSDMAVLGGPVEGAFDLLEYNLYVPDSTRGPIYNCGYNAGYLKEIVTPQQDGGALPDGVTADEDYIIYSDDLLDFEYGDEVMRCLRLMRAIDLAGQGTNPERYEEIVTAEPPGFNDLYTTQANGIAQGHLVWYTPMVGIPQWAYDELIYVSLLYVQAAEATAHAALAALTLESHGLAYKAVASNSLFIPWLTSYRMGLIDMNGQLATFVYE